MSGAGPRADSRAPTILAPSDVAPGIAMLSVRTPTLPPATHTNCFVVGSEEIALVEPASPYPEEIDKLAGWVEQQLAQGKRLRCILLTHHHPDHVGGAAALRARLGAPLWAHAATAERLRGKLSFERLLEHGERIVLDGPAPLALEAVHTPGHAPGHLCFLEPESRTLIAGDMVASVGTIVVDPHDGDMQQYLASLEQLDALDTRCLLPAHGLPIQTPRERLRFYVQHRLMREAKVAAALAELGRAASLDEIVPIAYADTPAAAWPLARLSAEAHLIKLAREGRAEREQGHAERWRATS
jgi:glyoxylase-like metal-dependent hydrolase (beta-lactamase superfamily II)